jgi:hypothetical protein
MQKCLTHGWAIPCHSTQFLSTQLFLLAQPGSSRNPPHSHAGTLISCPWAVSLTIPRNTATPGTTFEATRQPTMWHGRDGEGMRMARWRNGHKRCVGRLFEYASGMLGTCDLCRFWKWCGRMVVFLQWFKGTICNSEGEHFFASALDSPNVAIGCNVNSGKIKIF